MHFGFLPTEPVPDAYRSGALIKASEREWGFGAVQLFL
jgi:hypothetical protein